MKTIGPVELFIPSPLYKKAMSFSNTDRNWGWSRATASVIISSKKIKNGNVENEIIKVYQIVFSNDVIFSFCFVSFFSASFNSFVVFLLKVKKKVAKLFFFKTLARIQTRDGKKSYDIIARRRRKAIKEGKGANGKKRSRHTQKLIKDEIRDVKKRIREIFLIEKREEILDFFCLDFKFSFSFLGWIWLWRWNSRSRSQPLNVSLLLFDPRKPFQLYGMIH